MRSSMPLRWIEEAESRRVLAIAPFEEQSVPGRRDTAEGAPPLVSPRLRSWLAVRHPMGLTTSPPPPAPDRERQDGRS